MYNYKLYTIARLVPNKSVQAVQIIFLAIMFFITCIFGMNKSITNIIVRKSVYNKIVLIVKQ